MFLRRLAGPLLASVKETTGIVGLDVVPNAREALITLYQQTLKAVEPIPESAQYRKSVEALTHHRLKVRFPFPFPFHSAFGESFYVCVHPRFPNFGRFCDIRIQDGVEDF
jgi:hypothetical protein